MRSRPARTGKPEAPESPPVRRAWRRGRGWSTSTLLHELPHNAEELVCGEGLREIVGGPLALAPHPVALLVLGAHEHHRGILGPGIAAEPAEDLVTVPLGH